MGNPKYRDIEMLLELFDDNLFSEIARNKILDQLDIQMNLPENRFTEIEILLERIISEYSNENK
jgi:hypothetical protein